MKKILSIAIISFLLFYQMSSLNADIVGNEDLIKDNVSKDNEVVSILKLAEVYPNPAEDYIYLKIKEVKSISEIEIEVMSIIGNTMKVSYEKVDSGLYKINLTNIPVGHYYVMLTVDSEKSLKKFLKK